MRHKFEVRLMRWREWRKHHGTGKRIDILVLLGIIHSPAFNLTLLPGEVPKKFFYIDELSGVNDKIKGVELRD